MVYQRENGLPTDEKVEQGPKEVSKLTQWLLIFVALVVIVGLFFAIIITTADLRESASYMGVMNSVISLIQ